MPRVTRADYIPLQQHDTSDQQASSITLNDPDDEFIHQGQISGQRRFTSSYGRRKPISWKDSSALGCCGITIVLGLLVAAFMSLYPSDQRSAGTVSFEKGLIQVEVPELNVESQGLDSERKSIKAMKKHPITLLIEQAEEHAREMAELEDSIRTLEDAVRNYKETFGMDPPEGFDVWFEFASSVSSTRTPSLLPEAHLSVMPYLALPAETLRSRAIALQQDKGIFGMVFYPEADAPQGSESELEDIAADGLIGINNTDFMVSYMSPRHDYPDLLRPIIPLLPRPQQPGTPLQMTMCVRDGGCRLSSGILMDMSRNKVRAGQEWNVPELEEYEEQYKSPRGWSQTCDPPLSPFTEMANISTKTLGTQKSFIDNHLDTMDFCQNTDLLRLNGELIMESDHIMRPLAPMLAVSKPMHGADMLGTPTRAVRDQVLPLPWSQKTKHQVAWRGTLTGAFHRDRWDWRSSQRHRLSSLVGNTTRNEQTSVLVEVGTGVDGIGAMQTTFEVQSWGVKGLVDKWMDVGVIKEDVHNICGPGPTDEACRQDGEETSVTCPEYEPSCDQMLAEYQWVERMNFEDSLPYRYRLDVDGYGWSSRWQKLLRTNSVVLKSTIYPEWWTAQAIPWYHYVPLQYDYEDLWDILFYLDGAPDGSVLGHEAEAELIAKRGSELVDKRLRWEDMQSYMLLLLLEYRRAWSNDREAATFRHGREN